MVSTEVIKTEYELQSVYLNRAVALEIYAPLPLPALEKLNLLLLNDGQDAAALGVQESMASLYAAGKLEPLVIVAVKASDDRMQEYGVRGCPDFKKRGAKAGAYTNFIIKELLPYLYQDRKFNLNGKRVFAGCSLGGLSAFDIAWNHDGDFDAVGVFSAAFWWRRKDIHEGYQEDQDRILHRMIRESPEKPDLKFWIMTGTNDETDDRNGNFIIDSIDDAIDVIKALEGKGFQRPADISYYEVVGGKHEQATWSKAFPAFLLWAFARKSFLR